jgi:hypothetical protein
MTPQSWRLNLLAAALNDLRSAFRVCAAEPTAFLGIASRHLEQARPLLEHDGGSVLAADCLLDETERYLRYAEFRLIAENKKRADPATYQALRSRLLALFQTPVPGIGGFAILGEFDEWERARDALEDDGNFAEARRWCELAERKLPEATRTRQEAWHAAYGSVEGTSEPVG